MVKQFERILEGNEPTEHSKGRGEGVIPYPDPTPEMLNGDPLFDAIWEAIKKWDISRHNNGLYAGATGNDARHIYDAIKNIPKGEERE